MQQGRKRKIPQARRYTKRQTRRPYAGTSSEKKYYDGTRALAVLAAVGTIVDNTLVAGITQGGGDSQRIGRKIELTSLHIQGSYNLPATANPLNAIQRIRFVVYIDKQSNGAAALNTDIMKNTDIDTYRNLSNTGRFIILYDHKLVLTASIDIAAATTNPVIREFKVNKTLNIPIEYKANAGAIADLTSNNLGILAYSSTGLGQIQYRWRIRYSDK